MSENDKNESMEKESALGSLVMAIKRRFVPLMLCATFLTSVFGVALQYAPPVRWRLLLWTNQIETISEAKKLEGKADKGARILIHIGKSGGMTVRAYARNWIDYEVHTTHKYNYGSGVFAVLPHQFKPIPEDRLYITVRDPIERVISAWNYRKEILLSGEGDSVPHCPLCEEKHCFAYYDTVNDVAEALYTEPIARGLLEQGCIQHWKENYTFYITPIENFIRQHPHQVEVIRQEHLSDDLERLFHIGQSSLRVTHPGPTKPDSLSTKGRVNLRRFLDDEYKIYFWLLKLKGLAP